MPGFISRVLHTSTIKQSVITVVSTFTSAGLGAIYYISVAKILGPHNNGLFTLAITIFTLGVTLSDLGMNQSLVRFVGEHRKPPKFFPYAQIALKTKFITGFICLISLTLGAPIIASEIIHQPELVGILPIVGLAVFLQLFFTYTLALAQGLQKFLIWGGVQIGTNLLRLILLFISAMFIQVSPIVAIFLVGISSFSGFIITWKHFNRGVLQNHVNSTQIRHFWSFNKWTAIFIIIASFVSRLDTLLTGSLLSLSQTGIYGLAALMVSFLPQLSTAIGVVTSVKFASMTEPNQAHNYLKKATLLIIAISFVVALAMIPASMLFISFTGAAYRPAFIPFIILLGSLIIFMAGNPMRDNLLYYHKQPKFFVFSAIGQGLVLILLSLWLIPIMGIIGSSLAVLGGHIFLLTICFMYYYRLTYGQKT